jgi:hypothetical protein
MINSEEAKDYVKSLWSKWIGLQMCYNGYYKKQQWSNLEQISKNNLSPNCSLKLECMKLELLVIVDQNATVNIT